MPGSPVASTQGSGRRPIPASASTETEYAPLNRKRARPMKTHDCDRHVRAAPNGTYAAFRTRARKFLAEAGKNLNRARRIIGR